MDSRPAAASRSVHDGATIAAHAQHVRYGLSTHEPLGERGRESIRQCEMGRGVEDLDRPGLIASVAHVAYHLGAIRQIDKGARGPREGTF